MQKIIFTFIFILLITPGQSQSTALYLQGQYNQTLRDVTRGNNPWALGAGLQLFIQPAAKLKPVLELTADAYLDGDKLLRLHEDGTPMQTIGGMVNLLAGVAYSPSRVVFLSLAVGPSFTGGRTCLGIKPSIGFFLSSQQKAYARLSYINVFNREAKAPENFTSLSLAFGLRLH